MATFWGAATEIRDLGVVAEQCPHCVKTTPCLIRSVSRGVYVFFVKMSGSIRESSCLCTVCLRAFPSELWRYLALVPVREAKTLPLEELQARTNPGLEDRALLREQVSAMGGDARFAVAYEQLEGMRAGAMQAELLKKLLDWGRLEDAQRSQLVGQVGDWSRAWQFARQVALSFPGYTGCMPASLVALVIWSAFLWAPAVRSWLWGTITAVAGLGAAALTGQVLLTRQVQRWTRNVLVPEAQLADVSLPSFITVVDDLPGSRLGVQEELWPVKDQLETIRKVLAADRML